MHESASLTILISLTLVSACGNDVTPRARSTEVMSKKDAIGSTWSTDWCAYFDWYGDAICDTFCPLPDPDCDEQAPTDHRPYCGALGSTNEGWYWGDTRELIELATCAELGEPECAAIGSRSEGWYTPDDGLIVWDNCRAAVRIGIDGEACGPSIGFSCHTGLYCQGVPEGVIGGNGICRAHGSCETAADCVDPNNAWIHPMCAGYATCELGHCGWVCGMHPPPPDGPWVWTTVLLPNVQSEHPYANNFTDTWDVQRPGASDIKVRFNRIDVEADYDSLTVSGNGEESALLLEGNLTDYWTPAFTGDTLHLTLSSDYSITGWGFKADTVSYREQLARGMCVRDEHCTEIGETCRQHLCINPYAPCYGECWHDDHCDDGAQPMCEVLPDACAAGQILAFVNNCYECVNPDTCDPGEPLPGSGTFESADTPLAIPDNDDAGIESAIEIQGLRDCAVGVHVQVSITHTYRGDLVVELVDPAGSHTVLWNREGGGADNLEIDDLVSGIPVSNGSWTLLVSDRAAWDTGDLESWSLELTCQ